MLSDHSARRSTSFATATRTPRRRTVTPWWLRAVAIVAAVLVAGCTSSGAPSFNPTGPCTTDGRVPGAYPALEARIPAQFQGRAPGRLDSGRNCTAAGLGTLASHEVTEIRFAGGLWDDGDHGITLAIFQGTGLTAQWLGEWYEASARAGRNTQAFNPTRPTIDGRQAYRLDVSNLGQNQVVITWPSANGDAVLVVLSSDEPEATIQAAVAALR